MGGLPFDIGRWYAPTMDEFMALLAALQGEDETPPTVYDDLTTSYQAVYDSNVAALGNVDSLTNQLAEKDQVIMGLQARISELEADNYEEAMNSADDNTSAPDAEEEINGIDDLFESDKEDEEDN